MSVVSEIDRQGIEKQQILLRSLIAQGDGVWERLGRMLHSLSERRIARLLESNPPNIRRAIWELLDVEREAKVLEYLRDEFRTVFIQEMKTEEVVSVIKDMETDDMVDILQHLPDTIARAVLGAISKQDRARVERVLDYPADTAGGLTNTDALTIRPDFHVDSVLNYMRHRGTLPPNTDQLFVVDKQDRYLGSLSINRLITADTMMVVRELMDTSVQPIDAGDGIQEVVNVFDYNDVVSMPVVGEKGLLLGRITVDDVLSAARKEAEHSVLGRVGLASVEEDIYASVRKIAPKRLLWLGVNLGTAFIAAVAISIFEDALKEVVTLAILMPIVASMGGVAGTQILTLMERGGARGNIGLHNLPWFLRRETIFSIITGVSFALLISGITYLWFQDYQIGVLLAFALTINLMVAAMFGVMLPSVLRMIGVDPAVAGSVVLTTVTDVVGFATFLGLASWMYL